MMGFFTRLDQRAAAAGSLLCVGLDPHRSELPEPTARGAKEFCLRLIEATAEYAAAFKPNAAFFEVFGGAGADALKDVIAAVPPEVPVILDAKRGDIASTAEAYAEAAFRMLGATAITISPYLGYDSLLPFLADPEHGAFLLCKTSNPGSGDLQDLRLQAGSGAWLGDMVYAAVARRAVEWNRNDNLGLVVGATHPEHLRRVRALARELWILAPGVGAQGGDLESALEAGLRADGSGLLVPVSRAISQAENPRSAANELCRRIQTVREQLNLLDKQKTNRMEASTQKCPAPDSLLSPDDRSLTDGLLELGCVQFGKFTLKSGLESPIYLDLRRLVSAPALLEQAAKAYARLLGRLAFDRLAALPYAALPIGTAVSLQGGWPLIYPRKEVKSYGTKAEIEGMFRPGETVVVLDDLATTGSSKFEAIEKLEAAGLVVRDVVVLIDRQSGAAQALEARGYRLNAVLELERLLAYWESTGRITAGQAAETRRFIVLTRS